MSKNGSGRGPDKPKPGKTPSQKPVTNSPSTGPKSGHFSPLSPSKGSTRVRDDVLPPRSPDNGKKK